jgi:hypothetical protein
VIAEDHPGFHPLFQQRRPSLDIARGLQGDFVHEPDSRCAMRFQRAQKTGGRATRAGQEFQSSRVEIRKIVDRYRHRAERRLRLRLRRERAPEHEQEDKNDSSHFAGGSMVVMPRPAPLRLFVGGNPVSW